MISSHEDRLPPDGVTIRRAGVADATELGALGSRTFHSTYVGDMPSEALDAYVRAHFGPEQQRAELADPACHVLVAEQGTTMTGYALLRGATAPIPAAADATVQLERLYVDEQVQARGVGTALLARALEWADSHGHRRLWLTVWERNIPALAAYRRWGFIDVGEVTFDLAGETQRDRVLARAIA